MATPLMTPSQDLRVLVAYWLRHYREAQGMTQTEASAAFGPRMHPPEISRYENGKVLPRNRTLVRFAQIYEVQVSAFFQPIPEGV